MSFRVVLPNQAALTLTDELLQPTEALCRGLELNTHWDADSQTLYINSPVHGKQIAIDPDWHEDLLDLACRLRQRLTAAGASVTLTQEGKAARPLEERVRIARQAKAHLYLGISASSQPELLYSWPAWLKSRKLADLLREEMHSAGLPLCAARFDWLGKEAGTALLSLLRAGMPAMIVRFQVDPGTARIEPLRSSPVHHQALASLYRSILRFFGPHRLADQTQLPAESAAAPAAAASPPAAAPAPAAATPAPFHERAMPAPSRPPKRPDNPLLPPGSGPFHIFRLAAVERKVFTPPAVIRLPEQAAPPAQEHKMNAVPFP